MTGQPAIPPQRVLLEELDVAQTTVRLTALRELLAAQAPDRQAPELLVASKYFAAAVIPDLIAAGATLLGENRAEALDSKQQAAGDAAVQWDFIGALQSRKAPAIAAQVSRIHTLGSVSAARKLQGLPERGERVPDLLLQVNIAEEEGKGGVRPRDLEALLEAAAGLPVTGLMTMPPLVADPEQNRRWFAALRELADAHDLRECSMGTSQDVLIAAQEGATVVRIGGLLTSDAAWNALTGAGA